MIHLITVEYEHIKPNNCYLIFYLVAENHFLHPISITTCNQQHALLSLMQNCLQLKKPSRKFCWTIVWCEIYEHYYAFTIEILCTRVSTARFTELTWSSRVMTSTAGTWMNIDWQLRRLDSLLLFSQKHSDL